jgi:hypothetical protein
MIQNIFHRIYASLFPRLATEREHREMIRQAAARCSVQTEARCSMPYPPGTVLYEWTQPEDMAKRSYSGRKDKTGCVAVVEIADAESSRIGGVRPGDWFLRIVIRYGSPSSFFSMADKREVPFWWWPEGEDPNDPSTWNRVKLSQEWYGSIRNKLSEENRKANYQPPINSPAFDDWLTAIKQRQQEIWDGCDQTNLSNEAR